MYDKFIALHSYSTTIYLGVVPNFWSVVNRIEVDVDPCALE